MRKAVPDALFALSLAALCAAGAAAGADARLLVCAVCAAGAWLFGLALAGLFPRGLRLAAGAACAVGSFSLVTLAASALHLHALVWAVPAAGAVLYARARVYKKEQAPGAPWLFAVCGALVLVSCAVCVLPNALPGAEAVAPNHDLLWNAGNAEAFLRGFPPADPRFSGCTLTYHWLTELLAAGFSMASGASCYDVLAFFLPPAMLCALACALAGFARVWFSGQNAGKQTALLFILTFLGGCAGLWKVLSRGESPFGNSVLTHLYTNVNAVATGAALMAALFAAARVYEKTRAKRAAALALFSLALLCAAKGPAGGIAALALVCAAALRLALRRDKAAAADLALAIGGLAVFGAVYVWLFSAGAGSSVHFSAHATLERLWFQNILARLKIENGALYTASLPCFMLLNTLCFAPFACTAALVGGVRALWKPKQLSLVHLALLAGTAGGFAAFFLFEHEAYSQVYFAFAGLFCANALAARYADALFAKRLPRPARCAAWLLVAVSVFSGGAQLFSTSQPKRVENRLTLSAGDAEAADFLRASLADGLFITNRIHTGAALEGLSNVYSGLSGCASYCEGFKYAISNLGVTGAEAAARVEAVRAVFAAETAEEARDALPDGVTAVVVSLTAAEKNWDILEDAPHGAVYRGEEAEGFAAAFRNDDVIVYLAR